MAVPFKAILIAIFIHTLWGGNPVAVKFGLLVFPPMSSAFIRFALAIACIAVWASVKRIRFWPRRHEWPVLLGLGVLFTIQIATMNIGFDLTTGAMASVLISTNPLFAALFAHHFIAGDRITLSKALGLGFAFLGTVLVLLRGVTLEELRVIGWGNWVVLLSACLLGVRLILAAKVLQKIDEVRVAVWQMLFSLPVFAAGALAWETIRWENLQWQPIAGLAYQGFVVAGLGFMVSFYLMKRYTPSVMVSFNFVSPIAGVLLSAWLLGDRIAGGLVLGMALVALGLLLIARR
jgi:drug/metabolite transporter (DMT)-like permease